MTQATGYTRAQIVIHWVTVVLVALQYVLHEGISETFEDGLDAGALAFSVPAIGHMAGGAIILFLVFWRIALRREHGAPPAPEGEPEWAARASVFAHRAFYLLLVLLPVTGGLAWGMASETMGEVHGVLRALLLALIVAHVGAVVVHQAVWKTGLLDRMTRPAG